MTNSTNKPTSTFWIISITALLWNIMGVSAYLGQAYMTNEVLAALPGAEQAYYTNLPTWVTAAFALSVFSGTLGCIIMLLRKKLAIALFIISLVTVLLQFVYNFILQKDMEISIVNFIMPVVVIIIASFLVWYSKQSAENNWIS